MNPFLTYINFCYNTRQIADNQCYLHPQYTLDCPFSLVPGSTLGVKGEKIGVGKKKGDPFFLPFSPLRSLVQG